MAIGTTAGQSGAARQARTSTAEPIPITTVRPHRSADLPEVRRGDGRGKGESELMAAIDGPNLGSGDVTLAMQVMETVQTSTQKGASQMGKVSTGLAARQRLNQTVTKVGAMMHTYSPELTMILGGQELL